MIKLPWKRGARPLEPRPTVNPRILELETAKQILEEIFHTRPSDVDEIDPNEAGREEQEQREVAGRGGDMAKRVLPG